MDVLNLKKKIINTKRKKNSEKKVLCVFPNVVFKTIENLQ